MRYHSIVPELISRSGRPCQRADGRRINLPWILSAGSREAVEARSLCGPYPTESVRGGAGNARRAAALERWSRLDGCLLLGRRRTDAKLHGIFSISHLTPLKGRRYTSTATGVFLSALWKGEML